MTSMVAPTSKRGTRNAELGTDRATVERCGRPGLSDLSLLFRVPRSAFRILPFAQRQDVREEPIGAGDTGGQLSEKAQPRVDVRAFSYPRHEQAPRERRLARVVRLERPDIGRIPIPGEVQPPRPRPAPPDGPAH